MNKEISFLGLSIESGQPIPGLKDSPLMATRFLSEVFSLSDQKILYGNISESGILNEEQFRNMDFSFYIRAYQEILKRLDSPKPLVTWGGDHSIGLSSVSAFCTKYPSGYVLWIDAHADLNSPEASLTGNFHGMPLSIALGINAWKNPDLVAIEKKLKPEQLIYLGLRDVDPYETQIMDLLKIKNFTSACFAKLGLSKICRTLFERIGNSPVHISFDIDSIDPEEAPATGVKSPKGLSSHTLLNLTQKLAPWINLKSVDVVEINPHIGSTNEAFKTYLLAISFLRTLIGEKNISSLNKKTIPSAWSSTHRSIESIPFPLF